MPTHPPTLLLEAAVNRLATPCSVVRANRRALIRARTARRVVADYLLRWSIELLIKDEEQHLGLGAYRVLRDRAVVIHLHLVDAAYVCLTHLGMDAQDAQGPTPREKNALRLPPIRQLKSRLRQEACSEALQDAVKVCQDKKVIRRLEKLLAA